MGGLLGEGLAEEFRVHKDVIVFGGGILMVGLHYDF